MVDTKTSDETAATTPTGAELIRVVQGGTDKKTTLAVAGHQFRGAKVRMTSDDTAVNPTGVGVNITYDVADEDTDSFWSAGTPQRLTIPAGLGITAVRLEAQVSIALTNIGAWHQVRIEHRNSAGTLLGIFGHVNVTHGATAYVDSVTSGVVFVDDGDYFVVNYREQSDTSVTIDGDSTNQTYLSLEVVGMEPV